MSGPVLGSVPQQIPCHSRSRDCVYHKNRLGSVVEIMSASIIPAKRLTNSVFSRTFTQYDGSVFAYMADSQPGKWTFCRNVAVQLES